MVVDFLGKEIKVGDTILYAAHVKCTNNEMELRRGTVKEMYEKKNNYGNARLYIKVEIDLTAPNLRYQEYDFITKTAKSVTLSTYKNTVEGENDVFSYVYVL